AFAVGASAISGMYCKIVVSASDSQHEVRRHRDAITPIKDPIRFKLWTVRPNIMILSRGGLSQITLVNNLNLFSTKLFQQLHLLAFDANIRDINGKLIVGEALIQDLDLWVWNFSHDQHTEDRRN